MLKASDLTAYDLPALSAALVALCAKRGMQHRAALRMLSDADREAGCHAGLPGVRAAVAELDAESATLAEVADFVDTVRAFIADENQRRPAPVLRLAPRPAPLPPVERPSIAARVLAALARTAQSEAYRQEEGDRRHG